MILAPTLTLSAGSGAAIVRPTFSRDFAGEKSLNNGTGPAITFTRASNATYFNASGVLQTASNDVARFDHDPATGANASPLGLLIEEARTNLYQRSAEFDNAYWNKTRASITANAIAAPDGTTSADLLVEDNTASNSHFAFRQVAHATANGTVTVSIFAKAKERDRISLTAYSGITTPTIDLSGGTVVFNLAAGTAGSFSGAFTGTATNATGSASITNVGGGWYRCSVTITPNGVTATDTQAYFSLHNGTSTSYTGDNTSGLYIWGAQLEAGAFPTSYIPTTTAAATRAADSAVVTPISSFYNQSEGTLFAEASRYQVSKGGVFATFTDGSDASRFFALETGVAVPTQQRLQISSAALLNFSDGSAGTAYRMIAAQKANDFIGAQNGTLTSADLSGSPPTSLTRLSIGLASTDTNAGYSHINGHIRKIAYYPRRLSNTLLQQLTT